MSRRAKVLLASVAALLTFVYWIAGLNDPFSLEPHAWASAHMALLARSLAQLGVVHLHGVPIQNNLPLGVQPDRYVHWPPLYPILLSVAFRIFGESEAVVHAFVIAVNLCYIGAFYFLVRRCFGRDVATLSLFALLTIPIFIRYGTLVWTPNAGLGAVCAAIYCFVRGTEATLNWKWVSTGAVAVALGVLLSWEVAPLGLVLLGAAMCQRSRARQIAAAVYAVAGLCTVAIVLVLLVSSSPELRNDLWATVRFRMGGSYHPADIPIHAWADHMEYTVRMTAMGWVRVLGIWGLFLDPLGLLATMGLIIWSWNNRKNQPEAFLAVGGLLGIVGVWIAVFPNHVYIHSYQALFAAPVVSIALGVALNGGFGYLKGAFSRKIILIAPLILIVPLVWHTTTTFRRLQPDEVLEYAKDIENSTPASAVVLSPLSTMVAVYYSHRHIIRAIKDDQAVRSVTRQAETIFPGSDIYIAIPPGSVEGFSCASAQFPLVTRTPNMLLFKVRAGVCD